MLLKDFLIQSYWGEIYTCSLKEIFDQSKEVLSIITKKNRRVYSSHVMYIFGQKNYKVDIFAFRKNVITGLITIMNSVISPDFFSMQLANIVQDKFLFFCVFTWTIDVIAGVSVSGILGLPGLGLMPEGIGIFTVPR